MSATDRAVGKGRAGRLPFFCLGEGNSSSSSLVGLRGTALGSDRDRPASEDFCLRLLVAEFLAGPPAVLLERLGLDLLTGVVEVSVATSAVVLSTERLVTRSGLNDGLSAVDLERRGDRLFLKFQILILMLNQGM